MRTAFLAIGLALTGCNEAGERALPNHYKWFSVHGDTGAIVGPRNDVIIDEKVSSTSIKVAGDRVYGVREVEPPVGNPPSRTSVSGRYGRFVLDTRAGVVSFAQP